MSDKFILNAAGEPERCDDLIDWATWFEGSGDARRIARDTIGDVTVSTVFLGLDHNYGDGPPLLYETMIFGGEHDEDQWRYSTRDEALAGHAKAVASVSQSVDEPLHSLCGLPLMTIPQEGQETQERFSWVCEFCFQTLAEGNLPATWRLIWQSAVCPDCHTRVLANGGYHIVKGGAYANGKPDPRAPVVSSSATATPEKAFRDIVSASLDELLFGLGQLAEWHGCVASDDETYIWRPYPKQHYRAADLIRAAIERLGRVPSVSAPSEGL